MYKHPNVRKTLWSSVRRLMGCNKGVQDLLWDFMVKRPYVLEFTAQGSKLLAVNSLLGHQMKLKVITT